jgi:hypothetical protein
MKVSLPFRLLFLSLVFSVTTICKSQAQALMAKRICFTDIFGYKWTLTSLTDYGDGTYSGTGTLEGAYPSGSASVWLDLKNCLSNGSVEIHGVNNNPDNCTNCSDSLFMLVQLLLPAVAALQPATVVAVPGTVIVSAVNGKMYSKPIQTL